MSDLASYNSAIQVAAAFLIFVVGYLALLILLVACILAAEGLRQGFIFARKSFSKPVLEPAEVSAAVVPAIHRSSAFFGWTHKLTEGLVRGVKHRHSNFSSNATQSRINRMKENAG
jgi:hypothetical protein